MRLYLIRHAQSENNILNQGTMHRRKVDPDLTELGYRQRQQLADFLATHPAAQENGLEITHLYTSPMYRSMLTAEPVAKALGLQPKIWVDLYEKGGMFQRQNGHINGFNGMTRSAILNKFPNYQLPDAVSDSGWYDASLGLEPETHSFFRAIKVAKDLRERSHTDDVLALISHAGFLDVLLKAIFAQLPSRPRTMRYYHENTAITRMSYHESRPILHYMNRVDHLSAAMRSF